VVSLSRDSVQVPQGLKSVRENWCRPFGTRSLFPLYPALTCRAITCRRFAAGFWWCLFHRSPRNPVLMHSLKPSSEGELYRSAKSAAPPKSELFSGASCSARRVCPQGEFVHKASLSARRACPHGEFVGKEKSSASC